MEGARRTAFIYRAGTFLCMRGVLCDLTTQIEHISLVVRVLGSLLICLLSFSSKAHNISSAMFYRIRVRYLHNTTESFTRLIGRTDLQYLGVIQRQRDTWLDINIYSCELFPDCHEIFHATVPRKVSRQQIHKIVKCRCDFFSFHPKSVKK